MHRDRKIIRDAMDPMYSEDRHSPKFSHLVRSIIRAFSILCLIVTINITLIHV